MELPKVQPQAHRKLFNGKATITLAIITVVLLFGGLIVRDRDQARIQRVQCEATRQIREDSRATWQEVRRYLLEQSPQSGSFDINSFVESILQIIPPIKCVDGNPKEVK